MQRLKAKDGVLSVLGNHDYTWYLNILLSKISMRNWRIGWGWRLRTTIGMRVTADVRQRSDGQFDLRGNHSGVNFIIAELPLQHIAHLVKEVGHGSVHVVDFLIHGFDGLCGLEINGSVHSRLSSFEGHEDHT